MGIFEPFREIGYVTSSVPFSVQRMNTETFVTVSIGKSWQIYNCAKLNLILSGPVLPKKITALASFREFTFAAYGTSIGVFKRAHQVDTWCHHCTKITSLLLLGHHILSLDVSGHIFMSDIARIGRNSTPVGPIVTCHDFSATCVAHPETYINKVLLGGRRGALKLLNVSTRKTVYEFKGWGSAVCCCAPSPALDVVAVGCADGKVHIHNIRCDREVITFGQDARGAVTALSFRKDGRPLLASGSSSGVVSVWNLEKRRAQCVMQEAHDGAVASLHFFAGEPVLMSSSADNSVKIWVFDMGDSEPRLLRFRKGHGAPPLLVRFHGEGKNILSAGNDRAFRLFSTIQDRQSRELSQRHVAKKAKLLKRKEEDLKLKPVVAFVSSEIRERDWCNVVTCHTDTPDAYVWRLRHFVIGEHVLSPGATAGCGHRTPVTACAISACGNFTVLGTMGGWVERFNLQSGTSRGSYTEVDPTPAHPGEVICVACDSTNTLLLSTGFHGDIKMWDFKGRNLRSGLEIGRPVSRCCYHRSNGLLAAATDDLVIRLYDVVASRMVRRFSGHTDRITDMCFGEDGKWLLSSSMDGSLRIWDVVQARQVDVLVCDIPVTTLSLSPAMDMLATAHIDQIGISLWINRQIFQGVSGPESCDTLPLLEDGDGGIIGPMTPDLVTLSLLPKSQWQNLVNLDVIRMRNRPVEPPKKPDKAPFFLPSVPSVSGNVVFKGGPGGDTISTAKEEKGRVKMDVLASQFLILLHRSVEMQSFSEFTDYIKGLSPSSLDLELRMIQIIDDDGDGDGDLNGVKKEEDGVDSALISLGILMDYFIHEVSGRNDFEFIQAVIRLFLKIHGETIRTRSRLREKARELLDVQKFVWEGVERLFQSTRSMITFLSHSQF